MQFSKLVFAAFVALASSVTAAPIAAGGDLIEARTGTQQNAAQAVGNIAQFQKDKNTGLVAIQLDPQVAASLFNTGVLKQFSGRDQSALQAVGNIAQFQHDTNNGGFVAIQEDPQVAISAGNTGILKQFHWARDTTQNAGQSVGNIVQSQSNSNSGGLVAIQVDPQVALSLGNLGLLGQSSSGGGSTTQNAGQAVGNIAQTQHNTNKGGLVGIQADPQIGISAGNAGALAQKIKW
jgi:hypothetical protein